MKDMTQGNPVKEVLLFSVPMILASVFQQMYNAVDSIIVGQFVGANALAAVGAAFPAMFLAMSVLIGITMGVQIIISQLFGAGEHERMRATFATSIISLMILVVIASVIGYFASGTILELMNTPPEIIADSKAYLDEIFKGLIFMFLYNLYTSVLRGVGDSKTPLYFLIISSILNIVLDLVYVIQFGMGVRGVAVATVQSQAVSVILCIIYTNIHIPLFRLGLKDLRVDFGILRTVLRFGIPTAIQQSISAIGSMLVQGLVNSFGATAAAAFAAGNKVESFMMMPLINIANASSTYVAQNTGAGKLDRVRDGFKKVTVINVLITAAISIIPLTIPQYLMQIFISADETGVIEYGCLYLSTLFFFFFLQALMFSLSSFFRGVGDMNVSLAMSMIALFVRIGSAYALAKPLGYLTISISQPIGWVCALALAFVAYRSGRWTRFSIAARENENQLQEEV